MDVYNFITNQLKFYKRSIHYIVFQSFSHHLQNTFRLFPVAISDYQHSIRESSKILNEFDTQHNKFHDANETNTGSYIQQGTNNNESSS